MTDEGGTPPADQLAEIGARLRAVREQTSASSAQATRASSRSQQMRAAPAASCDHSAQLQQMQAALDSVQQELDGLRAAMRTRGVIEQAKGMLMLRHECDADAAFDVLVELSQNSHRRLVEVAEALVREWSSGGDGAARRRRSGRASAAPTGLPADAGPGDRPQ